MFAFLLQIGLIYPNVTATKFYLNLSHHSVIQIRQMYVYAFIKILLTRIPYLQTYLYAVKSFNFFL